MSQYKTAKLKVKHNTKCKKTALTWRIYGFCDRDFYRCSLADVDNKMLTPEYLPSMLDYFLSHVYTSGNYCKA